jgi:hypothetical protein
MPGISEQMQSLSEEIIKSHTDRKSAIKYIRGEVKRIQKTAVEFRTSFKKELDEANKNWTNMYKIIKNKKMKLSR